MDTKLANIRPGYADVTDTEGYVIGYVQEKVTHYNLRRVIVSRGWFARSNTGQRFPEHGEYSKRSEAVAALSNAR